MKIKYYLPLLWLFLPLCMPGQIEFSKAVWQEGFIDFHWDEKEGKIYARLDHLDQEMLYNSGLAAGVGSNDIGLDRGQLGGTHVVKFHQVGSKVLLIEQNYDFRAISDNPMERKSVEEAFAQSVLWGFEIEPMTDGEIIIDLTDFLLRDAHHLERKLGDLNQGYYSIDNSRSAIYLPRTKNFPKNTEFEATTTYVGTPQGQYISSVVPSAEAITVRQHHSFIELPDGDYSPRKFDPRCGFYSISFHDYATAIHEPVRKQYIARHRLKKKDPNAELSEAEEPIVYYVDPGAPEPIRSALMEGASWWNQAFEAAGFKNAFQVRVLPDDADPMDVRYNLIQWVHRSTRGWSYGDAVIDPRTGEIIKGHVSLGSLRVRQDFLIAQGLSPAFGEQGQGHQPLEDMALARLRQLAAHEVGHTLGLAHNFAASTNERASVMDYPHPIATVVGHHVDFSNAYDNKIGAWDKRTILYGYQQFNNENEAAALEAILAENTKLGLRYLSDQDARSDGSANPYAHLWDNGADATAELKRMINVRATAMSVFGADNIRRGEPMSKLEDLFVPLYLAHRYQVEATAKLIGGQFYAYSVKGHHLPVKPVDATTQRAALEALLTTIDPAFLRIPERILALIPPPTMGDRRGREQFNNRTAPSFDPLSAAEASAAHSLHFILNPQRLSRVVQQSHRLRGLLHVEEIIKQVNDQIESGMNYQGLDRTVAEVVQYVFVHQLMRLVLNPSSHHHVRGAAIAQLQSIKEEVDQNTSHGVLIGFEIEHFLDDPEEYIIPDTMELPDGSPIGSPSRSHSFIATDCGH